MKALEVARYIIAKSDNVGDLITNKKLQKLLYYVKAWGLVYFDEGVIEDEFEAWIHGPVCVAVYQEYKRFGYNPIGFEYPNGMSSSQYIKMFWKDKNQNMMEMIDAVFAKYSVLSSFQLELLTHSEKPWIEARGNLLPIENGNTVIQEETMKNFYSKKNG